MKAKTDKYLTDLALETGGMVSGGKGPRFNTSGKKAARPRKNAVPAPKPAPKPEPAESDQALQALTKSMSDQAKANLMMIAELRKQVEAMQNTAIIDRAVITSWEFDFHRNKSTGYLEKVTAQAYSYGEPLTKKSIN